jgi:hypothetical protein
MSSYYAIDDDAIWSKEAPSTHVVSSEYYHAMEVFLFLRFMGFSGKKLE